MTGAAKLAIRKWLDEYPAETMIEVLFEDGAGMSESEWSYNEECYIESIDDMLKMHVHKNIPITHS